jgi:hypothetical protein
MSVRSGGPEGRQKSKSLYLIMIFADWRREADLSADLYRERR